MSVPNPNVRKKLGRGYAYTGNQIEIFIETELKVDDGMIFDTKVAGAHRLKVLDKPEISGNAKELAEPKDRVNFFANIKAIPPKARMITLALVFVGGIVALVNSMLGLHDQFVPESQTYFYSHSDSDGDGQSPLMNSLALSGGLGAAIWFAMRRQLRKYMKFEAKPAPGQITPDTRIAAADLIDGKARVPLEGATFRIVAYNRELGKYTRGSGTNQRTVSFATPARAVVLYEQYLPHVPAHTPLSGVLEGSVEFAPLFAALYPPQLIGSNHGIDVHWEIQLIHPKFVDHEVVISNSAFEYEHFLNA